MSDTDAVIVTIVGLAILCIFAAIVAVVAMVGLAFVQDPKLVTAVLVGSALVLAVSRLVGGAFIARVE